MKRNKAKFFYAWLLMTCFVTGQYIVYVHQHKIIAGSFKTAHQHTTKKSGTIIQEKCSLCDAMHHTNAVIGSQFHFSPNIVTIHFYQGYNYDFVSIALILSSGRAPPVISFLLTARLIISAIV